MQTEVETLRLQLSKLQSEHDAVKSRYEKLYNLCKVKCNELDVDIQKHLDEETIFQLNLNLQPPPEILSIIFGFVIPPASLFDSPLSQNETWCQTIRMKKTLLAVCRAWYGPAVEFLYEFVAIRRYGHISALLRTFREQPPYGSFVKRVALALPGDTQNPTGIRFLVDGLSTIMESCPRLQACHFPWYWKHTKLILRHPRLEKMCGTLTHLELARVEFADVEVARALNVCKNLVYLGVATFNRKPTESNSQQEEHVTLELLEHLQIHVLATNDDTAFFESWRLPRLSRFSLHYSIYARSIMQDHPIYTLLEDVLKARGKTIRQLHLRTASVRGLSMHIPHFISPCPVLEHLIFTHPPTNGSGIRPDLEWIIPWLQENKAASTIFSYGENASLELNPSLKLVDVWTSYNYDYVPERYSSNGRLFRTLDIALFKFSDIPFILPPTTRNAEPQEHSFPGVTVVSNYDSLHLKEIDGHWSNPDEEGSDSEYIPNDDEDKGSETDDEWSCGSDLSGGEYSSVEAGSEENETEEEINEEKVLEIFTRMLNSDN